MKNYTLIQGDCLEVMRGMADNSVDCVITSPPYNINRRIHLGKWTIRSVNELTKYGKQYHDALSIEDYFSWQMNCITEMLRVSKTYVFYNIQIVTGNKPALFRLLGSFADNVKEIFIWDKIHSEPAISARVLNSEYEFIICFAKDNAISRQFEICNFERGTLSNIFRIGKNSENNIDGHSASYPIALPIKLIDNFTQIGSTVLDPFCGLGTTGCGCVLRNRNFIGIDINFDFCKIAKARIKRANLEPCDIPQRQNNDKHLPLFAI